jgi:hypothetical protein
MSATLLFSNDDNAPVRDWDRDHDINLSNGNACAVLTALGFEFRDGYAEFTLAELQEACRLYRTSNISEFVDTGKPLKIQGNVIDCGRGRGYITERVRQIEVHCIRAAERGATRCCFV